MDDGIFISYRHEDSEGHARALHAALSAGGFTIDKMRYVDSLGFAATLAFKATDNGRGDINRSMLRLYDRFAFPVSLVLDNLARRWFGKNLLALARNPEAT